jgi:subtilisin family serine protease
MAALVPALVYAQASVHSLGGTSLFAVNPDDITQNTVDRFKSDKRLVRRAVNRLKKAGFTVLNVSDTTIGIAAPAEVYARAFNTEIVAEERPTLKQQQVLEPATFLDSTNTGEEKPGLIATDNSELEDLLEGVALSYPVYLFEQAFAPTKAYWHLRVPGDVSLALNADRVHRLGYTGKRVRVTMVDTGWYEHPYFKERGYNYKPATLAPGAANPTKDENGHGTAESANVFAVAPDVLFNLVKQGFDATTSFNAAVQQTPKPHIISCSWGFSIQAAPLPAALNPLAAAIANAVSQGITVVFSAGNGHWGFPGQHPDVISAGGVFRRPDGGLQASDYSSGFQSNIYPGRKVPDVCGLVGMLPRAAYLMLPVPPQSQIDQDLASGSAHPNGDETTKLDGWAAISGTSAAAPQLAGVCALLKQAKSTLTPAQMKAALRNTALDVTAGNANSNTGGNPATVGEDLATGKGLVDAFAAVKSVLP